MNMNLIFEQFIARYFDKKLMPGIRENVRRLFAAHPSPKDEDKAEYEKGKDYYVNSFGFQTEFMMRYMLMAFVAVSAALLVISAAVNRKRWRALRFSRSLPDCAWCSGLFVKCVPGLWCMHRNGCMYKSRKISGSFYGRI